MDIVKQRVLDKLEECKKNILNQYSDYQLLAQKLMICKISGIEKDVEKISKKLNEICVRLYDVEKIKEIVTLAQFSFTCDDVGEYGLFFDRMDFKYNRTFEYKTIEEKINIILVEIFNSHLANNYECNCLLLLYHIGYYVTQNNMYYAQSTRSKLIESLDDKNDLPILYVRNKDQKKLIKEINRDQYNKFKRDIRIVSKYNGWYGASKNKEPYKIMYDDFIKKIIKGDQVI